MEIKENFQDQKIIKPSILVFPHIPKTGGTTLLYHFRKNFGDDCVLTYGLHSRAERFLKDKYQLEELPKNEVSCLRVIQGHGVDQTIFNLLPNADIRLLVILRSPVPHTRSRFNQQCNARKAFRSKVTTEHFVKNSLGNFLTNTLLKKFPMFVDCSSKNQLDKTISILQKFNFVYTTELMDYQAKCLMSQLHIPVQLERRRIAEKKEILELTDEAILQQNELDAVLFERANKVLENSSNHNPFGFDEEGKKVAISKLLKMSLTENEKVERAYENLASSLCKKLLAEVALEKVNQGVNVAVSDPVRFKQILHDKWENHRKKLSDERLLVSQKKLKLFKKKLSLSQS